ncbi:hypothetical protein DASC09_041540 [Saccharomycopsis crataegensis]|uniref:Uncharacterized protein n=1 Tax=Saccharomycopsis crataegensis TaxID=43959 RepID=A0AAV5QQ48_9ASCO|nr:hypothetical protein DASC09_041540 [Saccharomycopsis crataegensis]
MSSLAAAPAIVLNAGFNSTTKASNVKRQQFLQIPFNILEFPLGFLSLFSYLTLLFSFPPSSKTTLFLSSNLPSNNTSNIGINSFVSNVDTANMGKVMSEFVTTQASSAVSFSFAYSPKVLMFIFFAMFFGFFWSVHQSAISQHRYLIPKL